MKAWVGVPLNLDADHINDLVWQAGNALMTEVDGDARLILLELLAGSGWVGGLGTLADVFAGMGEGGFGEGHDLVVRNRHVVAHDGRLQDRKYGRGGETSALVVMLVEALGLTTAVKRAWRR